jgi:hypothetical protein
MSRMLPSDLNYGAVMANGMDGESASPDPSLLEHSLRLSVWERMVEHQQALELVEILQKAKIKRHGRAERTAAPPCGKQG